MRTTIAVGSWMADPGHCLMKSCAKRVRSGPSFGIARRRYAGRVSRSAAEKSGYSDVASRGSQVTELDPSGCSANLVLVPKRHAFVLVIDTLEELVRREQLRVEVSRFFKLLRDGVCRMCASSWQVVHCLVQAFQATACGRLQGSTSGMLCTSSGS